MKKSSKQFYVVAIRQNSQLRYDLSTVYIGQQRSYRNTVFCTFDYRGSSQTLKFVRFGTKNSSRTHSYRCVGGTELCYKPIAFIGFDTTTAAKKYLEKHWSDRVKYNSCIKKLSAAKIIG